MLVVEGSIPNESDQDRRLLDRFRQQSGDRSADDTSEWLDRLAPKALAIVAAGTCATYGGIHAMAGNPTGAMGVPDYLGWNWRSKAGLPIVCVPGCPGPAGQHVGDATLSAVPGGGQAPMIPLDDNCGRNGCSARRSTMVAIAAVTTRRPNSPPSTDRRNASSRSAAGGRWSSAMCPSGDGWMASADARTSVASASAAPCRDFPTGSCPSWMSRPEASYRPSAVGASTAR